MVVVVANKRSLIDNEYGVLTTWRLPDDVNKHPPSFVLLVAAVRCRPLSSHHSRLTAILAVPDHVERVIERFDADDSSLWKITRVYLYRRFTC